MRSAYKAVAVPALVIILAANAEECDTGGELKACDFRPQINLTMEVEPQRYVVATATAECDNAPRSHDFSLVIQQQDEDGSWGIGALKDSSPEIPRPGNPVTLRVRHICIPGLFRATARASGSGPTGESFDFTDHAFRNVEKEECT